VYIYIYIFLEELWSYITI